MSAVWSRQLTSASETSEVHHPWRRREGGRGQRKSQIRRWRGGREGASEEGGVKRDSVDLEGIGIFAWNRNGTSSVTPLVYSLSIVLVSETVSLVREDDKEVVYTYGWWLLSGSVWMFFSHPAYGQVVS